MRDRKEYMKKYYQANKEKWENYVKCWRKANHKKMLEQGRKRYQANPEKGRKRSIKYRQEHKKERHEYRRYKRKTDLKFNLNNRITKAMAISLKGNKSGRKWEKLVGYILEGLIKRLKKTMPKGYTWQDYLDGKLHIDHIVPVSVFNFTKPEHPDFKKCWTLKNLQLLPAKENIIKSNNLDKPFQPALKIRDFSGKINE